jgi:hypothetical protein
MKRTNLLIVDIGKGEEMQAKGTENIFNKLTIEVFPYLDKYISFRTLNREPQERTSLCHIKVNTSGIWNKERILKAATEKHKVTCKTNPLK